MKTVLLLLVLSVGCNKADDYYELPSAAPVSAERLPPQDPPPGPIDPIPSMKGVCKIETAPNYEARDSEGSTTFYPDNSLCEKIVCEKEHEETPFDLIHPEEVKFGCNTSASEKEYDVTLGWFADDASNVWMDGERLGSSTNWRLLNEKTVRLKGGCHTLAIHAIDVYQVISGILAYLKIDGKIVWKSGDGNQFLKAYGPQTPVGNWQSLNYDESAWKSSESCSDITPWDGEGKREMYETYDLGSKWIWWSANCKNLTQAYFRLSFSLTPPPVIVNDDNLCKK